MEKGEKSVVYEAVAVHDFAKYKQGCIAVLDEEWSRSTSARLAMLEKSNDKMPYSLAFVEKNRESDTEEVIGHSRLCRVHQQPTAGFVESVVIRKDHRGKGLGRKIMDETENHARKLGLSVLYLCTDDKQDFYKHLGYEFSTPVLSFGSATNILSEQQLAKLVDGLGLNVHSLSETDTKKILSQVNTDECCVPRDASVPCGTASCGSTSCGSTPCGSTPCGAAKSTTASPPPPAPPLPCQKSSCKSQKVPGTCCANKASVSWLKKVLN